MAGLPQSPSSSSLEGWRATGEVARNTEELPGLVGDPTRWGGVVELTGSFAPGVTSTIHGDEIVRAQCAQLYAREWRAIASWSVLPSTATLVRMGLEVTLGSGQAAHRGNIIILPPPANYPGAASGAYWDYGVSSATSGAVQLPMLAGAMVSMRPFVTATGPVATVSLPGTLAGSGVPPNNDYAGAANWIVLDMLSADATTALARGAAIAADSALAATTKVTTALSPAGIALVTPPPGASPILADGDLNILPAVQAYMNTVVVAPGHVLIAVVLSAAMDATADGAAVTLQWPSTASGVASVRIAVSMAPRSVR